MIRNLWFNRKVSYASAVIALIFGISASVATAQSSAIAANPVPVTSNPVTSNVSRAGFLAAPSIYLGSQPSSVATGDLRSSGTLDLVTANPATNNVLVFLGQGAGKFASAVSYPAGSAPVAVSVADINGDGRPDIVVANGSGNSISVLAGRGDGTFAAPVSYSVGVSPSALVIGNFSGKGANEVAVVSNASSVLAVFTSNGNGGFNSPESYSLARVPVALASGDFRRTGHADLALANADGSVSLFANGGTGQFSHLADLPVASGALSSIAASDLKHDGTVDLVVTDSANRQTWVVPGKGDGTFSAAASYAVGIEPVAAQVADVDGDGIADLVVVNKSSNTFSVLSGNGDGTFKSAQHFVIGNSPSGVALGSFYSTSHSDLAAINLLSKSISVPQGNGDGTFQASRSYITGEQPVAIASGDLTGEGHADLAVANYCGSNSACTEPGSVAILLADSTGAYRIASVYSVGAGPVAVSLRDVNGDGKLDLVALNRVDKTATVRLGAGDGSFGQAVTFALAGAPIAIATGSFHATSVTDLAILEDCGEAKCTTPGSVEILAGDGAGNFRSTAVVPVGYAPASIAAGALTSGGHVSIAVLNRFGNDPSGSSAGTVSILLGDGAGNFTAGKTVSVSVNPGSLTLGSLTSGGTLDLIVSSTGANALTVLRGNGDGTFKAPVSYAAGSAPGAVLVGDFDGDGIADVAVANASDSTVSVFYGKGDGTLGAASTFPVGAHPAAIAAISPKGTTQSGIATVNGSVSSAAAGATAGAEVTALLKPRAFDDGTLPTVTIAPPTIATNPATVNVGSAVTVTVTGDTTDGVPPGMVTVTATSGSTTTTLCSSISSSSNDGSETATYACPASASTSLAAGTYTIGATYTDGTTYASVTSAVDASTSLMVGAGTATLSFVNPPTTAALNASTSFSVKLAASPSTPIAPAGTITLKDGASTLCTITVSGTTFPFTSSCSTSTLPAGSDTVTASYSADSNFTAGSVNTTVAVSKGTVAYTLTANPSSAVVNQPVAFTVAFTAPASTAPIQPAGTITLTHGTTLCTIAAPATSCTFSAGFSTVSTNGIDSSYGSDSNFNSTSFTTGTEVTSIKVAAAGTSTTVTGPSTPNVHVSETYTATVAQSPAYTSTTPYPTGTVKFTSGTTTLCNSVTLASGTAQCAYTFSVSGAETITAVFTPSGTYGSDFTTSTGTEAVNVGKGSSSISLASSVGTTAVVNQPITLTSTLTPAVSGGAPSGTVTFYDGTTALNCTPTNGGTVATKNTCALSTGLAFGSHSLTAQYSGDSNYGSATSTAVMVTVGAQATTTTVTTSNATPTVNQAYTLTATITPTSYPSGTAPNANVVFAAGSTTLCTSAITAKGTTYTATCTSPANLAASATAYTITATFNGANTDSNFTASNGTTTVTVAEDTPKVTLTPSPASIAVNAPLTLTAAVAPNYTGTIKPGGTVTFSAGSVTNLCAAAATVTNGTATCQAVYADLPAGSYSITANYAGDGTNFKTNTSTASTVAVTPAATTVVITSSASPTAATVPVTYTATVTTTPAVPSGGIAPTGTISFVSAAGACNSVAFTGSYPYTATCTVTYPAAYTSGSDATVKGAIAADNNFATGSGGFTEAVSNFTLTPTGAVAISPGYNNTNDIFNPSQTVQVTSASVGSLAGPVSYTCTVMDSSGTAVTDPSCSPTSGSSTVGAAIPLTIAASSSATAGAYIVTVTVTDGTVGTLSQSTIIPLSIASTSSQPVILAGSAAVTPTIVFGTSTAGASLVTFSCPKIYSQTQGALDNSSGQYLSCTGSSTAITAPLTSADVTITPVSNASSQLQKSGGITALAFGVPVLVFFGWFGRNKARKNLFRMMAIVALAMGALAMSGCGGSFKTISGGLNTVGTKLGPGGYIVEVEATDSSTPANTYYADVSLTVN